MKTSNSRLILAVGSSVILLHMGWADATIYTWTGSAANKPGDWAFVNNWNPSGVPATADDALFTGSFANQPILNNAGGQATTAAISGLQLETSSPTTITIPTGSSLAVSNTTLVRQSATIALNGGTFTTTNLSVGNATFTVPSVTIPGTLSGTGTIAGNVTVTGTHAPGNSPGIQTVNGTLNYSSTSIFEWELFSNTDQASERGVAATGYDAVNVNGSMTANGLFKVVLGGDADFNQAFWHTNHTWAKVFDVSSNNITGNFTSFALYDNAITPVANLAAYGSFSFDSSTGALNWSAVPEPTSALVGLVLGAGLLRRRRTAI